MNRLNSNTEEQNRVDLQAAEALSCRVEEPEPISESQGADVLESLITCESRQVALDTWGMSLWCSLFIALGLAIAVFSLVTAWIPYYFPMAFLLVGLGGIFLALQPPWQDKRGRQKECKELLEKLSEANALEGPKRDQVLDTLYMLASPASGETRETRKLARSLHRRFRGRGSDTLPIIAETPAVKVEHLPLPSHDD